LSKRRTRIFSKDFLTIRSPGSRAADDFVAPITILARRYFQVISIPKQ